MKKIILLFVVLAALLTGANAYAPQLVKTGLYYTLSEKMDLNMDDIEVTASPGAKCLLGEIDAVRIHSRSFRVGDLLFDSLDCTLQDVRFDPAAVVLDQRLTVTRAGSGEMTASVSSEELRRFLMHKMSDLSDVDIAFQGDVVVVTGTAKVGGILPAHATVQGRFGMQGSKLLFIPDDISVESMGMKYTSNRMGKTEIYDFQKFPLGMVPDRVTMQDNVLTIHGRVTNS